MYKILTDGVAPMHGAPYVAFRIVLVEQVVLTFKVYEPVGVVHPICGWREMQLWSMRFLVIRGIRVFVETGSIIRSAPDTGDNREEDDDSEHMVGLSTEMYEFGSGTG